MHDMIYGLSLPDRTCNNRVTNEFTHSLHKYHISADICGWVDWSVLFSVHTYVISSLL